MSFVVGINRTSRPNESYRVQTLIPFPLFFFFEWSHARSSSDCEIIDVVEQAKDDKLADKLYKETLRVLKLK